MKRLFKIIALPLALAGLLLLTMAPGPDPGIFASALGRRLISCQTTTAMYSVLGLPPLGTFTNTWNITNQSWTNWNTTNITNVTITNNSGLEDATNVHNALGPSLADVTNAALVAATNVHNALGGGSSLWTVTNMTFTDGWHTYVATTNDKIIIVNNQAATGSHRVILPTNAPSGFFLTVKLVSSTPIGIIPNSRAVPEEVIDGAGIASLTSRYQARSLLKNGTNWWNY